MSRARKFFNRSDNLPSGKETETRPALSIDSVTQVVDVKLEREKDCAVLTNERLLFPSGSSVCTLQPDNVYTHTLDLPAVQLSGWGPVTELEQDAVFVERTTLGSTVGVNFLGHAVRLS